jgi:voltage-gated potassium channel
VEIGVIILTLASVAAAVLETEQSLRPRFGHLFLAIEEIALVAFTLEYALRLWASPCDRRYDELTPLRARLAYARSPQAVIDLLAIAPLYLSPLGSTDFQVLMVLRLTRYFKLARYSPGMRSLAAALHSERRALFASGVILLGLVLLAAAALHVAEVEAQPEKFGSIPRAMWWAIVTLTTVGYGDVVPVTALGRIIAGFTAIAGLMTLPVGIIATAFAEQIHRQEFVVTWGMIARVPLFGRLDASGVAEIMRYLRAQTVPAGEVVVRRGEQAESMYFIAEGEVEVELAGGPTTTLGRGSFFGEVALLRPTRRAATVRAIVRSKLLALDAVDLEALTSRNAEFAASFEHALREHPLLAGGQDILPEELTRKPPDSLAT